MSTPTANENGNKSAMMYAPPWARDRDGTREDMREAARKDTRDEVRGPSRKDVRESEVRDAACAALEDALRDAPLAASENALAASEQLRRTLPPASQLGERRTRWREPAPFEGDIAIVQLRERPSLEPVVVPAPRAPRSGPSTTGLLTRVVGAVGLAALAAFFMVGTTPFSFAIKAEGETSPSLWSRLMSRSARPQEPAAQKSVMDAPLPQPSAPKASGPAPTTALAERFAAVAPAVEPPTRIPARPVQTVAVPQPQVATVPPAVAAAPPAPPPAPAPEPSKTRTLDAEEIATLYRRSEELISQGDIAGGRLLLTRAAEAGDARSALALGATYDPSVLGKLGVLGVKPNPEKARTWYARAAEFGSGEASRRLEVLAQGR